MSANGIIDHYLRWNYVAFAHIGNGRTQSRLTVLAMYMLGICGAVIAMRSVRWPHVVIALRVSTN